LATAGVPSRRVREPDEPARISTVRTGDGHREAMAFDEASEHAPP